MARWGTWGLEAYSKKWGGQCCVGAQRDLRLRQRSSPWGQQGSLRFAG